MKKYRDRIPPALAITIAQRMSEVAETHKVVELSNAYAAVSSKLESLHAPFASDLSELDLLVIQTFVRKYMKDLRG